MLGWHSINNLQPAPVPMDVYVL